ncbi:MAG: thiol peroxidase [Acidobacteria bacterium]|nr:thiol peroxidase [Acidobacteriota bacterium]
MIRTAAITLRGNPKNLVGPELKVGDAAPNFETVDTGLKTVTLADTGDGVRVFSVVPSLDTPVCDLQTKKFNEEATKLPNVKIYTISMDLPFAMKRWCGAMGVDNLVMLSDHRTGNFGAAYGTMIEDLRIEARAIFVIDSANVIRHVEYVGEVGNHPNYDAALEAAQSLAG